MEVMDVDRWPLHATFDERKLRWRILSRVYRGGLGRTERVNSGRTDCARKRWVANKCSGQGTVELACVMPIVLIIAVIAVNACTFFSECAAFDRQARQAVRVYATSPTYGEGTQSAVARVQQTLGEQFKKNNESIDVWSGSAGGGCMRYTAKLNFSPTLFGMGLKDDVFGVSLPVLSHEVQLVVDPYNPSVLFG